MFGGEALSGSILCRAVFYFISGRTTAGEVVSLLRLEHASINLPTSTHACTPELAQSYLVSYYPGRLVMSCLSWTKVTLLLHAQ